MASAPDDHGRVFIVEQGGRIWILKNDTDLVELPFIDLRSRVTRESNEQGLLSLAFHPDFPNDRRFFVNYTRTGDGATVIDSFEWTVDNPDVADPESRFEILVQSQRLGNHNGGQIAFGPDGYLYIGFGDEGGGNDTFENGQDLTTLHGAILRIDVDSTDPPRNYVIPESNPFVGLMNVREEIWSYGLRNPWRFSFDRLTGDLIIADVGQGFYEEIDFQRADSPGGQNYGWDCREGNHDLEPEGCEGATFQDATFEMSHFISNSITGGFVYRGSNIPSLVGKYVYGDYELGQVWILDIDRDTEVAANNLQIFQFGFQSISSFGEDAAGELYVCDFVDRRTAASGRVLKLVSTVPQPRYRLGDVNRNGNTELADAVDILRYLFVSIPIPCLPAADANQNGRITIADPVFVLLDVFVDSDVIPEDRACQNAPPDSEECAGVCP